MQMRLYRVLCSCTFGTRIGLSNRFLGIQGTTSVVKKAGWHRTWLVQYLAVVRDPRVSHIACYSFHQAADLVLVRTV